MSDIFPVGIQNDTGISDSSAPLEHEHGLFSSFGEVLYETNWTGSIRLLKAADFVLWMGNTIYSGAPFGAVTPNLIGIIESQFRPYKDLVFSIRARDNATGTVGQTRMFIRSNGDIEVVPPQPQSDIFFLDGLSYRME